MGNGYSIGLIRRSNGTRVAGRKAWIGSLPPAVLTKWAMRSDRCIKPFEALR